MMLYDVVVMLAERNTILVVRLVMV